jgi:hypothetical protein
MVASPLLSRSSIFLILMPCGAACENSMAQFNEWLKK